MTAAAKTTKKTYCVVCPTWEIKNPHRCSNTVTRAPKRKGGKEDTLYFCTRRCKDRYLKAPTAF